MCSSRCCQYTHSIQSQHAAGMLDHCAVMCHCPVTTCNGSGLCNQNIGKCASMIALHRLFGGARLEMVTSKDSRITFADIAGIDQVKAEIIELVQFLKNPKKFTDLGARSPAGVLLVGPPGTGDPSHCTHTPYLCHILYACSQHHFFYHDIWLYINACISCICASSWLVTIAGGV
jgi:hypothetical protein